MLKDELKVLLGEDTISEETATKLDEMIQTLLDTKLSENSAALEESHNKALEEIKAEHEKSVAELNESHEKSIVELQEKADAHIEEVKNQVDSRIQESVDSAVAEFIAENKEQLLQLEDYTKMKSAFDLIQEAFEKNAFSLNKNAETDSLKVELQEATKNYDSIFEELESTKKTLEEANMKLSFDELTSSLAETQKEKVRQLSEEVSFDGVEEYTRAVSLIVEQVLATSSTGTVEKQEETKNENKYIQGFKDFTRRK